MYYVATTGQRRDGGKYPNTWDSNYGLYPGLLLSQYQNTTLHTFLEHACLFTLALMARLHTSFLQRSAHRLVQPYRIRLTISCIQATMSLQHFLNWTRALKDRSTIRIGFIFGELHNRCAINSSNYTHGPITINAPHQYLASPALLYNKNRRS
jgi:hypothetical protein